MAQAKSKLHRLYYRSRATPAVKVDLDFVVRQIIVTEIRQNRAVDRGKDLRDARHRENGNENDISNHSSPVETELESDEGNC